MTNVAVRLAEWQSLCPAPGSQTAGLSLGEDPAVRDFARRLTDGRFLEVLELRAGLSIRSTSFVGRVKLGAIDVIIEPKLQTVALLKLLRYAYGLRDFHLLPTAVQASEAFGLPDLLAWQLVKEAEELVARGLARGYLRRDERLPSPRGRIDFRALAGRGALVEATLPCSHHRRDEDRPINRALLAGLRLAASIASDKGLRARAGRLGDRLAETITSVRLDRRLLHRLEGEVDRTTRHYEAVVSLIRLLHEARGLSLDDDEAGPSLPGFLFDMNRFFQALLGRFLDENLPEYAVRSEHRLKGLIAYLPGWNPRSAQAPTPRPDFIVSRGANVAAILDAKYRDLWEHPLPRDMLYQLAIYAMSHSGGNSSILYPTIRPEATEARIEVRDPMHGGRRALVSLRPVDVRELDELVSAKPTAQIMRRRAAFARRIAFGGSGSGPA